MSVMKLFCFFALGVALEATVLAGEDLQQRIDAAAKAGGGVVEVPAGLHESDALCLRSGVTLRLAEGAVLKARLSEASYAPTEGHAFILAERADNVAIEGPGTIDGGGAELPPGSLEWLQQPRLVWFRDCRKVRVENVTLQNGRRWTCYFDRCEGVLARKVRIRSLFHRCCDGIDLECRDALVEDCDIESHDDAICFKNRSSDYEVRNVEVRNCRLASNSNFIKIGTETLGTIRDIRVHHCTLQATSYCIWRRGDWTEAAEYGFVSEPAGLAGITLQMNDGGILERVHVHDIEMKSGVCSPIAIRLTERKGRVLPGRTALRDILVENVRGRTYGRPSSSIVGTRGRRVENVTLRNIDLDVDAGGEPSVPTPEIEPGMGNGMELQFSIFPTYGFFLRHVDGVRFENVVIRPRNRKIRNLIRSQDASNLDLTGLKEL